MDLKLKLVRKQQKAGAQFVEGKLYIYGVFECYTVEDADRKLEAGGSKVQNRTAIPKGIYKVAWTKSTRFGKFMPEILNVPGFAGIRMHAGNDSGDTEGCIICGSINDRDDDDWVGGSKVAIARLYPKIEDAIAVGHKVTLEIV